MLKKPFEAAADLFRESALIPNPTDAEEQKKLYHGLALIAEGLHRLEKRMDDLETELHDAPRRPLFRRRVRPQPAPAPA